jgi:hypothetical protein
MKHKKVIALVGCSFIVLPGTGSLFLKVIYTRIRSGGRFFIINRDNWAGIRGHKTGTGNVSRKSPFLREGGNHAQ